MLDWEMNDVSAKDIALWLIGHFGVNGLTVGLSMMCYTFQEKMTSPVRRKCLRNSLGDF